MALTLNNFWGAETGGTEELLSADAGVSVNSSIKHTGSYSYACDDYLDQFETDPFESVSSAGTKICIGFWFYSPAANGLSASYKILRMWDATNDDFSIQFTNAAIVRLLDSTGTSVIASSPVTRETWHYIELYVDRVNSGSAELFINGTSIGTTSTKDFNAITGTPSLRFSGAGPTSDPTYFDDIYFMSGATAASDRLEGCEVISYRSSLASANGEWTDLTVLSGFADLDSGQWVDAQEITFSESNVAAFTGSGIMSGGINTDDVGGSASTGGPNTDTNIEGDSNIVAMKGIWRAKRSGGGAVAQYGILSNSGEGTTSAAVSTTSDLDLTTAYVNYTLVSETNLPLSSEYGRIGFKKSSGGQDYTVSDMLFQVLHVPSGTAAYTLDVTPKAFTFGTPNVDLLVDRQLDVTTKAFTLGTPNVDLGKSVTLDVTPKAFTFGTPNVDLLVDRQLDVTPKAFTLGTPNVDLLVDRQLDVTTKAFTLGTPNVDLVRSFSLTVDTKAFTLGTPNVDLLVDRQLDVTPKAFTLGTPNVDLLVDRQLDVTPKAFTLGTPNIDLLVDRQLDVTPKAFTLGTPNVDLLVDRQLDVTPKAFTLGTPNVDLTYTPVGSFTLDVTTKAFTLGTPNVDLVRSFSLTVDTKAFTLGTPNVDLLVDRQLDITTKAFTLGTPNVDLLVDRQLDVTTKAFTLGTPNVDLLVDRQLDVTPKAFTLGADNVDLNRSYYLGITTKGFTLGTDNVDLLTSRQLDVTPKAFTLGTPNVDLTYTPVGSFTLDVTPKAFTLGTPNVDLLVDRQLDVTPKAFTLGTPNVDLLVDRQLDVTPKAFTLGTPNVDLLVDRQLDVTTKAFTLGTPNVDLLVDRQLDVTPKAFTLGTPNIDLLVDRQLDVTPKAFTLGTPNVDLTYTPVGSFTLDVTPKAFTLGTPNVDLLVDRQLDVTPKAFTLGTPNVDLTYTPVGSFTLDVTPKAFTLGTPNVDLLVDRQLDVTPKAFTLGTPNVDLLVDRQLDVTPKAFTLGTPNVDLLVDRQLDVTPKAFTLGTSNVDLLVDRQLDVTTKAFFLTPFNINLTYSVLNVQTKNFILDAPLIRLKFSGDSPPCLDYGFKQEAKVYIYDDPTLYQIDISEINFSQTFIEHSYSNKSIHTQNQFEQSVINKANPANFDITIPALREDDLEIVFDKSLSIAPFDIYVVAGGETFLIENCAVTNANFIIEKQRPLSLGVSGEGTKVRRQALPTDPEPRSSTRTYNRVSDMLITLGGTDTLSDYLAQFTLELQNDIKWTPYTTINDALNVDNATNSMYPSGFTIQKRILSGTITQYVIPDNDNNLQDWNTNIELYMEAGQKFGGTLYGFTFDIPSCSFTNRINTGEIFTQSYDWRSTDNSTALTSIITYTTT